MTLDSIQTQNQLFPLQNVIHIGSLFVTLHAESHKLRKIQNTWDVARTEVELFVDRLSINDGNQVISSDLLDDGAHRLCFDRLDAAGVHNEQILLLPLQRQSSAQSQRSHYRKQGHSPLPLKGRG